MLKVENGTSFGFLPSCYGMLCVPLSPQKVSCVLFPLAKYPGLRAIPIVRKVQQALWVISPYTIRLIGSTRCPIRLALIFCSRSSKRIAKRQRNCYASSAPALHNRENIFFDSQTSHKSLPHSSHCRYCNTQLWKRRIFTRDVQYQAYIPEDNFQHLSFGLQ
jgi:hypothetical protein